MMASRVYMGGIGYRARERDIEHFFDRFGKIREISMKSGFCFVDFDDHRDAEDAVYELNGKTFLGGKVTVEIAKGTPHGRDRERFGVTSRSSSSSSHNHRDRDHPRRDSHSHNHKDKDRDIRDKSASTIRHGYKVRVLNLSSRITWQDLRDYMQQAGEVVFSAVDGSKKHEGVVEYAKSEFVRWAMDKLDGTEINGRKISLVDESKDRRKGGGLEKRSRSKSKTKSKSRSRSRSRSKERSAKKLKEDKDSDSELKKESESKMDTSDDSSMSPASGNANGNANGKDDDDEDENRARRKRSDADDTEEEED